MRAIFHFCLMAVYVTVSVGWIRRTAEIGKMQSAGNRSVFMWDQTHRQNGINQDHKSLPAAFRRPLAQTNRRGESKRSSKRWSQIQPGNTQRRNSIPTMPDDAFFATISGNHRHQKTLTFIPPREFQRKPRGGRHPTSGILVRNIGDH